MPNNIDNDSEQNKWSQRWKKYNPFSVANVWNGVQTIGKTTVGALKRLWNTDEEESWISRIGLFLPRVLGSIVIGAISAVATTVTAGVGAITAGIIGGGVQTIVGVAETVAGALVGVVSLVNQGPNGTYRQTAKNLLTSGIKDVGIGLSKVVVGSAIAGTIALGVITGIGPPALAAVSSVAIAGHSLGFVTALAPAVSAGHAFLVTAGSAIASAATTATAAVIGAGATAHIITASAAAIVATVTTLGIFDKIKSLVQKKKTSKLETQGDDKPTSQPIMFSSKPQKKPFGKLPDLNADHTTAKKTPDINKQQQPINHAAELSANASEIAHKKTNRGVKR